MPPEVLIYVQKIKSYLNNDMEAHQYFLQNNDENNFFKELINIALKNFNKNGDPTLTIDQFELIKTLCESKNQVKSKDKNDSSTIYLDLGSFGKLYMN